MRIDDSYGTMTQMPFGHMGLWMFAAVFILLAIVFGLGYAVGRSR